ncbi:antirestriction protein ArdA [Aeromonas veronii]|uniref:antirestriction protein ArdA n=1 Tax=Aeromonas veronii TaxID=654 RepID=UPI003B9EF22B
MRTIQEMIQAITARTIRTLGDQEAICVRWYALAGDFWIDAEDVAIHGSLSTWLEDEAGLDDEEIAFINNRDYEIMDDNGGLVADFCSYEYFGSIDLKGYIAAREALEECGGDVDMLKAGIACSIPLDKISEAYAGQAESDEDFAQEQWEQWGYMENLPAFAANYIDWEMVARDLVGNGYLSDNGYYFHNNF